MKTVTIYTDGACSGNPGPGGWGAILQYGEFQKEFSGGEAHTTNNRMELTGVITALEALNEPCEVELYSDSKYVIDALEKGWARGWKAKGWVKADKKPALNPDLWERLLELCDIHTVRLHWVKGHADNEFNNRCDELAVMESQKFKKPAPAEGEPAPALVQVSGRIWYLPGEDFNGRDRPFLYYIKGDRLALAVDGGNSPDHVRTFYAALDAAGLKRPDLTVFTHWHWDHTFGLTAVEGLTLASAATNEKLGQVAAWKWDDDAMRQRLDTGEDIMACDQCIRREYAHPADIRVAPATVSLCGDAEIRLGGVTCRVILRDSPHSRDGLFLYFPEERALAVGDGEGGDYYELGGEYDQTRLTDLLAFLEGLDYDLALPGHQDPWSKADQLADLRSHLAPEG